ncbi:MAG: type II toxin-antitoxin system VapC family toxin [Kofleriaceae bacterium]
MNLLLDTHVWLWILLDPKRLSNRTDRELRSTKNQLWLSPVSVWEASLLIEAKRLRVKEPAQVWLDRVLAEGSLTEAPVTHQVALESRTIGLAHADPADRFIAATAAVYELVLVTADDRLLEGRGFKTLEA